MEIKPFLEKDLAFQREQLSKEEAALTALLQNAEQQRQQILRRHGAVLQLERLLQQLAEQNAGQESAETE